MIRGVHLLSLAAIALAATALRSTEFYAARYQSLPVQDWLESRPPLAESAEVPAASELAHGLLRVMPLLVIRDDARPQLPRFGPPAYLQRTMGGVRDAARIELRSPAALAPTTGLVLVRLDTIVFNRTLRAAAWSQLMSREMDIRDPDTGVAQARIAGPDEPDGVWVIAPREGGGVATVSGHRGPVGFLLQVTLGRTTNDPAQLIDLSGRAERVARQSAADWAAWLEPQLPA